MLSAYDNPDQPLLMSSESQSPPMWRVARANMGQAMKDPKTQVAMAMIAQQMARMGQGNTAPMQRSNPMAGFDLYGNPIQ
jgi:hypothetical protein